MLRTQVGHQVKLQTEFPVALVLLICCTHPQYNDNKCFALGLCVSTIFLILFHSLYSPTLQLQTHTRNHFPGDMQSPINILHYLNSVEWRYHIGHRTRYTTTWCDYIAIIRIAIISIPWGYFRVYFCDAMYSLISVLYFRVNTQSVNTTLIHTSGQIKWDGNHIHSTPLIRVVLISSALHMF